METATSQQARVESFWAFHLGEIPFPEDWQLASWADQIARARPATQQVGRKALERAIFRAGRKYRTCLRDGHVMQEIEVRKYVTATLRHELSGNFKPRPQR